MILILINDFDFDVCTVLCTINYNRSYWYMQTLDSWMEQNKGTARNIAVSGGGLQAIYVKIVEDIPNLQVKELEKISSIHAWYQACVAGSLTYAMCCMCC